MASAGLRATARPLLTTGAAVAHPLQRRAQCRRTITSWVTAALGDHPRFQHRSVGESPGLEIPPERDHQSPRHRDDADPSRPRAAGRESGPVPLAQGAGGLPPQPAPRRFVARARSRAEPPVPIPVSRCCCPLARRVGVRPRIPATSRRLRKRRHVKRSIANSHALTSPIPRSCNNRRTTSTVGSVEVSSSVRRACTIALRCRRMRARRAYVNARRSCTPGGRAVPSHCVPLRQVRELR